MKNMKKILLFLAVFVFIAYGIIAILLMDFSFGSKLGPADAEIVLRYIIKDGNGEIVDRRDETVSMWNNADGNPETKKNKSKLLASTEFDMPGHNFNGWFIEGKKYNSEDWVPAGLSGSLIEVHSDWRPRILTVTYDGRLGSTPSRMSVFYGMKYGEAANAISIRVGHTLTGWYTLPDKQGEHITSTTLVDTAENIKLYAAWEATGGGEVSDTFTINFDANAAAAKGTVSIPNLSSSSLKVDPATQNMNANLPSAVSSNSNDSFAGWFEAGRLNGTQIRTYKDAQNLLASGSKTVSLIAKWTDGGGNADALRIDFDLGGIGQNNDQGVSITVEGSNVWFNTPMSNDPQYEFVRWTYNNKTVENSNDVRKEGAAAYAIVVAVWKFTPSAVAPFTVTFDLNTGTNNPNGSTVTVTSQNYSFRDATKTGSVFLGWHWNGVRYNDAFALKNAVGGGAGATVVAQWDSVVIPETYTVTLRNNIDARTQTITNARGMTNINLPWSFTTHTFASWRVSNSVVSTFAAFQYNVTGNVEIVAYFDSVSPATWTVTLNNNVNGATATIPNASGYTTINSPSSYFGALAGTFQYWAVNGSSVSTSQSFTYNVTGNVTLTAHYQQATYTVTLANSINSSTYPIYNASGNISISAPSSYFGTLSGTFQHWAVNGVIASQSQSFTYNVTGNVTLTAHYQQANYTITLRNTLNSAASSIPNANGNTQINTPSSYFGTLAGTFQYWAVNGIIMSYTESFIFFCNASVTLTAHYQQAAAYTVTLQNNVNGSTASIPNVSGKVTISYPSSYFGTLSGTFQNWTMNGSVVSTAQSFSYTVTGNVTLVANFKQPTYTVTLKNSINSTTKYINNASGNTIVGSPSEYFGALTGDFLNWTVNGSIVSYSQSFVYPVTGNVTIVANYKQTYTVTLKNNVSSTAANTAYIYNASGSTFINMPTSYFSASLFSGYEFDSWRQGTTVLSKSQSFYFSVSGNATLTAYYTKITSYTITLKNNINSSSLQIPNVTSTTAISSPSTYFGASTFNGYEFSCWKQGTSVVSNYEAFYYTPSANVTLTATYTEISMTIYFRSEFTFATSHPAVTTSVTFPTGSNVKAVDTTRTFVRWRLGNPYTGTIVTSTSTTKTAAKAQGLWGSVEVWAEWQYNPPTVYTYSITFKANGGTFPAGNYWGTQRSASTSDYTRTGLTANYYLQGNDLFSPAYSSALHLTRANVSGKAVARAAWLTTQTGILANLAAYSGYEYYQLHTAYNCGYASCTQCHGLSVKQLFDQFEIRHPASVKTNSTVKTLTVYATWYYL